MNQKQEPPQRPADVFPCDDTLEDIARFPVPPEYLEAVKAHCAAMTAHRDALAKLLGSKAEEDADAVDRARELQDRARIKMMALEPFWLSGR